MKIQCDVCGQHAASVFCCADEAALCDTCDRRVHSANKLAGKHRRFSLLNPSLPPLCDICQEKRAFLFCKEDRAVLCRDCDAPIHTVNEHTMKHSRFLLTGIRLSTEPIPTSDSSTESASDAEESDVHDFTRKRGGTQDHHPPTPVCVPQSNSTAVAAVEQSTISDYLMKTLPGWHVEDLLDTPTTAFSSVDVFAKMGIGDDLLPFRSDRELSSGTWWVPQVPQVKVQSYGVGFNHGVKEVRFGDGGEEMMQRWGGGDDVFAVPQIVSGFQHVQSSNKRRRG